MRNNNNGLNAQGGLETSVFLPNRPVELNYQFLDNFDGFGFWFGTNSDRARSPILFSIRETILKLQTAFGSNRQLNNEDCYSTFNNPIFMQVNGNTNYLFRLLGIRNSQPTSGEYVRGDIFFNPNTSGNPASKTPIGWRCIVSGNPGTWETFHYLEPAEPSPDISSSASLADVIADINDLKAKLRIAGLLKT